MHFNQYSLTPWAFAIIAGMMILLMWIAPSINGNLNLPWGHCFPCNSLKHGPGGEMGAPLASYGCFIRSPSSSPLKLPALNLMSSWDFFKLVNVLFFLTYIFKNQINTNFLKEQGNSSRRGSDTAYYPLLSTVLAPYQTPTHSPSFF